jgi:hypothetical protein
MAITWTRPGAAERAATANLVAPAREGSPFTAPAGAAPPSAAPAPSGPRSQAGALLVQLFHYLERHVEGHPALAPAIPRLRDAVAEYRSDGGQDPFRGVRAVVAAIQAARASDSALPEP